MHATRNISKYQIKMFLFTLLRPCRLVISCKSTLRIEKEFVISLILNFNENFALKRLLQNNAARCLTTSYKNKTFVHVHTQRTLNGHNLKQYLSKINV